MSRPPKNLPDESRCQARSKQTGNRCRQPVVPGRRVCRSHGGLSPAGIASAQYKHGRYSKYVPARLAETYLAATQDTELLSLRDEIALIDSRLADVLSKVDTGDAGSIWRQLRESYSNLVTTIQSGDEQARGVAFAELGSLIRRGAAEWEAWSEVMRVIELRRKVVESERKKMVELNQMMSAEKALTMVGLILETIRTHVRDVNALRAISADFERFGVLEAGRGPTPERRQLPVNVPE